MKMPSFKTAFVILFVLWSGLIFGFQIQFTYNSRLYDPQWACTSPGLMVIEFGDDAFAGISSADPLFIKITLENQVRLCQTLVDLEGSANGHEPINLALALLSPDQATVTALPDAVSIIRWREGESEIWLKFNQSSTSWLEGTSGAMGPSDANVVSLSIGSIAMMEAKLLAPFYAASLSNLPSNQVASTGDAISTPLCLDHSQAVPGQEGVLFSAEAFQHSVGITTTANPASILVGDPFTIDIAVPPNSFDMGEPAAFELSGTLNEPILVESGYLFPWSSLGAIPFNLSFNLEGNIPLHQGSILQVDTQANPNLGFLLGERYTHPSGEMGYLIHDLAFGVGNGMEATGLAYCLDRDGYNNVGGTDVSQIAYLEYDGPSKFPYDEPFTVTGTIYSGQLQNNQAQISFAAASQPYQVQPGEGLYAETQYYCPSQSLPIWSSTQTMGELTNFGPELEQWPTPNNVANLVQKVFNINP